MTRQEFREKFEYSLNSQQKKAVETVQGAALLLAVPGSGKTTVLIHRLGYMVCCENIDPAQILTMTYTVAAKEEMKQRFGKLFGEQYAKYIQFRTINSVSDEIVNYYSQTMGRERFQLDDKGEAKQILGELYQKVSGEFSTESTLKELGTAITYIKNMELDEQQIEQTEFAVDHVPDIYRMYCDAMRRRRLMDYDDQMIYALNILKRYPRILNFFQDRFRYICVDEAQDTSKIQHSIIHLLAEKYGNIFMVGDEDQSIYGFRAAYPQALMNFRAMYPEAKILAMEENYRSSPEIVDAANRFVARNMYRYEKTMRANRPSGVPVQVIYTMDRTAQFKYLYALARNCKEETAVLYRNNDSCLPLVDMLEQNGIPYRCRSIEECTFFSHRMVLDIVDILNFALDPTDTRCFMRIYYKMGCKLNKQIASAAAEKSTDKGTGVLDEILALRQVPEYTKCAVRQMKQALESICAASARDALAEVWSDLEYGVYVENRKMDQSKYSILKLLARSQPDTQSFLNRLDELALIMKTHQNRPGVNFILSTVHSSKGLEYNNVYLLDVLDGILPSVTRTQAAQLDEMAAYEEERRLYYVAATRAKNELNLFKCSSLESEFTDEIMNGLPVEKIHTGDVFAPLLKNNCGKIYRHRQYGKSVILAQKNQTALLGFEKERFELMSFGEMLEQREVEQMQNKMENSCNGAEEKIAAQRLLLKSGVKVSHKIYGKGILAAIDGDIVAIRFERSDEVRQFSLDSCLKNDLLQITAVESV